MADKDENLFHRLMGGEALPADEESLLLQEVYQSFAKDTAKCPFNLGDLIVPRSTAPLITRGRHIVLRVAEEPVIITDIHPSDPRFRLPLDIYVGAVCPAKHVHTFWAPSFMFEAAGQIVIIGAKA